MARSSACRVPRTTWPLGKRACVPQRCRPCFSRRITTLGGVSLCGGFVVSGSGVLTTRRLLRKR
eukprot:1533105-Alexandrium_andersonii.AAC.1